MIIDSAYTALYKYTKALSVALGYRDPMTRLHSNRVLSLAEALGRSCGLSTTELELLKLGASFHDIGKIGIADSILMKETSLNNDEWQQMMQHSEIGENILLATELEGSQPAAKIIRHHHEHYDGSGYPDKLSGEDIPVLARILSITDSYDAIAMKRAYHQSHDHAEIMKMMHEETGSKHDPYLMRIFSGLIETSPLKAIAP